MSDYSIEKGGQPGLYLVNHLFDPRHGLATIGYARKTEDGKWSSECREVTLEGTTKSRTDATDKVFKYWKENFSKEALTKLYGTKTKGGHRIDFIHGGKDWIVASSQEKTDGGGVRRFASTWKDGKYSCADEVNGVRSDAWDLVKVAPEKTVTMESLPEVEVETPVLKKPRSMRP